MEAAVGLLDQANPADRLRQTMEEETGYRIFEVEPSYYRAYFRR